MNAYLRALGISDQSTSLRWDLVNALGRARLLLPLPRPVPLPRLAYYCSGDPHYFDLRPDAMGQALVYLASDIVGAAAPNAPDEIRALLRDIGIVAERLVQTVLTYKLVAIGHGPADRILRIAHGADMPIHLTLNDLTRHPPQLDPSEAILIVENPSVVEEALLRGSTLGLACTAGFLTAADHAFLALVARTGCPLDYAGDLDLSGHLIARTVRERYGAQVIAMDDTFRDRPGILFPAMGAIPALCPRDEVVYQEHAMIIDLLLGPDPTDPLGQRVGEFADPPAAH